MIAYNLRLGTKVYDKADPRHIGRIDAIHWSSTADITWEDTGWKSLGVPLHDLRKYVEEGQPW